MARTTMAAAARVAALLVCLGLCGPALAGGGGENVFLVVNADSWASLAVANKFIELRQVPPDNVFYLHFGEHADTLNLSVNNFRMRILMPVLETIDQRGLGAQIDYIVYSSDVPYVIDFDGDLNGRPISPPVSRKASITGMTYLYPHVLAKDPAYLSLGVNRYFRRPVPDSQTVKVVADLQSAQKLAQAGEYAKAEALYQQILRARPHEANLYYNHACLLAVIGKPDAAVAQLAKAVDEGWMNATHAAGNKHLESLRDREDFKKLLEKMKTAKPTQKLPGYSSWTTLRVQGFRSALAWSDNGQVDADGLGEKYMLSMMLGWTSGRGNSVGEVLACLERSAAADGSLPKGTVYFMVDHKEIRSTTRLGLVSSAIERLKEAGVAAQAVNGTLPKNKKDIAGIMTGTAWFEFKASGCAILPGAFADHLTSFAGMLHEDGGQMSCTEWIRAGASGTCGTVSEPYAIQAKFPTPFVHVFYANGCTLAEALYQSVSGPYQQIMLGDPLCRPWAKIPKVQIKFSSDPAKSIRGELIVTPSVANGVEVGVYQLFVDGKLVATALPGKALRLRTGQFDDGSHELRVVAIAVSAAASRGRAIRLVTFNNAGKAAACAIGNNGKVEWGKEIGVSVNAPGAKSVSLRVNGREVANVNGPKGSARLDSRMIGMGKSLLWAVGQFDDGKSVAAAPVTVTVLPPPALPAVALPQGKPLDGLRLTAAGRATVITGTADAKWLSNTGLKAKENFVLEGWYTATEDDLYQFQVWFDGIFQIQVDGKALKMHSGNKGWKHLPVNLKKGPHRVVIRGTPEDVVGGVFRFGAKGVWRLNDKNFKHYAAAK